MLNLDYIFPTPIWSAELDIDIREMQKICYEVAEMMPGKSRSNRGVKNYQSPDFSAEQIIKSGQEGDEFAKALVQIKALANQAFDTFESFATTLVFANTWININNKGGYNEIHTHPGALLSGVLYVKVPPEGDAGALCFHRNSMESYTIQSLGISQATTRAKTPHALPNKTYMPKEGKVILFPAWVCHGVRENTTDDDRISISFNLIPNKAKRDMHAIIKSQDEDGQREPEIYERTK